MDNFLKHCQDHHLIKKWICTDDNSDDGDRQQMSKLYPFFTFIWKGPTEKGHVDSMNKLWNMVDTEYLIHFEDDWLCNMDFYIEPLLELLKGVPNVLQLVLKPIGPHKDEYPLVKKIGEYGVYKYICNPNHKCKPVENRVYDSALGLTYNLPIDQSLYWWWSGFTLNPSIMKIQIMKERIGGFKWRIPTELFEYDYGQRIMLRGYDTYYINYPVYHIGDVSSYKLNNTNRYYD